MVTPRTEARFSAPDLDRLLVFSARLRAFMAMLARNPERSGTFEAVDRFQKLCDDIRVDLRVCTDMPPGVMEPRNERQALHYMQRRNYCRSGHWDRVQASVDRRVGDPRLLEVIERVVGQARGLGVPLFPAALDVPDQVHIGHAVERFLPWACWDLLRDWVAEAGRVTGYRMLAADAVPGLFALDPDAAEAPALARLKAERLDPAVAEAERLALLRDYSGGVIHE
jgi:hypothetical protein